MSSIFSFLSNQPNTEVEMTTANLPQRSNFPNSCTIEGCSEPLQIKSRGLCSKHYQRWQRHGSYEKRHAPPKYQGCSVEGCTNPHASRSFCNAHYANWYRRGDPLAFGTLTKLKQFDTLEKRFWTKVTASDPAQCWEWQGTRTIYGYGQLSFHQKLYRAHRVSFFIHNGYWPEEVVMHDCDNKICVNPHHLNAGTYRENSQQAYERGLYKKGEDSPRAMLSNVQVLEIRALADQGIHDRIIAKRFGVSKECVQAIRRRTNWRHL